MSQASRVSSRASAELDATYNKVTREVPLATLCAEVADRQNQGPGACRAAVDEAESRRDAGSGDEGDER